MGHGQSPRCLCVSCVFCIFCMVGLAHPLPEFAATMYRQL
ncbi:hypothetical protein RR42_m3424 [Cupriavidus basilensis]|uniref:Uncharacterized protein n=1 Tax=Cupriavidus basilensis TaxID=68895 RepID=A0A0C4YJC8_9BURK|nr:hypothetical protein RR42_m3424 [Cupriavidus basilensis]